ncbi:MAG: hypothetical protein IJV15_02975 [Lachnospiraceae bacterium]|nr:hypothetical protein [Lachnospiraceae bacterium]
MKKKEIKIDIKGYFKKNIKRIIICFLSVFGMGFSLSFLILCNLGTDTCTFMNTNVSGKIGLSFGNWQLIFNIVMLVLVIIFRRDLIGIGTVINMVLIAYYADFFDWIWGKFIPSSAFTEPVSRGVIFTVSLAVFIISAAIYMNTDVGIAPYDALAVMLNDILKKLPFFLCRNIVDFMSIAIGMLAGGRPKIGHILMALLLGPAITLVGKKMKKINQD